MARLLIRLAVKRLALSVAILFATTTLIFFLFTLVPGDVTSELLGLQSDNAARAEIIRNLGLDKPLAKRYIHHLQRLTQGDLGRSLVGLGEVRPLLFERLRYTFPLILFAAILSLSLGVTFAFILALIDIPHLYRLVDAATLAFASVPVFVTALALTVFLGQWHTVRIIYDESWSSAVLPIVVLSVAPTFWVVRIVSTDLRHILRRDFILFGRTLGFSEIRLTFTAFKNVSLTAALGTNLVLSLLMGTFFVEYAFNWPGLGQLLVYSVLRRDFPVVQAVVICFAFIIMLADTFVETWRRFQEQAI